MAPFLSLIRFPNLLIIAFTQCMMRYAVVLPVVRSYDLELQLSGFTFFLLVFSTMCTAAAGYAINDYFDVKTDNINRPNEVVVGKTISRRKTMMIHVIFCALGILTGGYVTWRAGVAEAVLIYIMIAGMLWLYSSIYKRQLLIGNLIVALFSALVPMMVLLDIPPVYKTYHRELLEMKIDLNFVIAWVSGVAVFAFLTTLSREIIKDAEDFEGDVVYGCRSLPVVWGQKRTNRAIICINAVIVAMLAIIFFRYLRYLESPFNRISFFYLLLLLAVPVIYISWEVYKAETSDDYRKAGNLMKAVMLAGIVYSGVVWLILR